MTVTGEDKVFQQGKDQLARIAEISLKIRQAVRSAIPAPPEQFFTMQVPGTVLNFNVSPVLLGCASKSTGVTMKSIIP